MNNLKNSIAKVESEITFAKKLKDKQKRRAKIVRSYKGDASTDEALVKNTKRGIQASEAHRDTLVAELRTQEEAKQLVGWNMIKTRVTSKASKTTEELLTALNKALMAHPECVGMMVRKLTRLDNSPRKLGRRVRRRAWRYGLRRMQARVHQRQARHSETLRRGW